jgi:hypothetical protein
MRSKENPPVIGPQLPRYGGRDFVSWAKNPEFRNEVEEYRSRAREIITSAGVPTAEIQLLENRFFWGSIRRQEEKEQRVFASLRFKFINFVLTSSPKGLRLFAKRHFPKWILRYLDWEGNDLDTMLESLQRMGTDVNPEELESVKELALETFFSRK